MTATTLPKRVPTPLEGKRTEAPRIWRCRYCAEGWHGSCPGAVRQAGKAELWLCECKEPGHVGLHCLDCKNTDPGEVDETTWTCIDKTWCSELLQKRRANSRVMQKIQHARSHAAIIKRAKRMGEEKLLYGVDLAEMSAIDRMHSILDGLVEGRGEPKKARKDKTPPRPKTGKCECCGGATKGGRFLPGHDAKLASALKERVASGDAAAYAEMERRNWLSKLPANLRKGS